MSEATRYTTGQVAEMTGVTRRTLHFYEEIGLLAPCEKRGGSQRLYDADQVEQVRYITALKNVGCSLKDIKALLELRGRHGRQPQPAADEMIGFINETLPRIREQIEVLTRLQNDFLVGREMLRVCNNCTRQADGGCRNCEMINERESVPGIIQEFWLRTEQG